MVHSQYIKVNITPLASGFRTCINSKLTYLTEAGLKDAHVRFDVKMGRHPDPIEFVLDAIAGSPMADAVSELTDDERTKMANEIVIGMEPYIDDDGVATSAECHTLTGVK